MLSVVLQGIRNVKLCSYAPNIKWSKSSRQVRIRERALQSYWRKIAVEYVDSGSVEIGGVHYGSEAAIAQGKTLINGAGTGVVHHFHRARSGQVVPAGNRSILAGK